MNTTNEMTDRELLKQIENCTFPPELFTHEIMLRMSWILNQKYDLETAIKKNCEIKENYFINALHSNKFNITLTKAYTEITRHFMENSSVKTFDKLLKEFPRLQYNFKDLVKTHFGYNILKIHRKEEPNIPRPILFTF
ncbi:hypothetical protein [Lutibacter sp.]|uniref:hypothetical protein n=1 Tax=Lutibacter sp. TaxID=1925666 RepID=UPI003568FA6D